MSDYVSSIKAIAAPRTRVYQRLSDLSGLANIQDRLPEEAREKITIEPIDSDSCAFVVPGAGRLVLRIIEREPEGTIKQKSTRLNSSHSTPSRMPSSA